MKGGQADMVKSDDADEEEANNRNNREYEEGIMK